MKVAVVGSGASAWAATQGIRLGRPDAEVTVFDDSAPPADPGIPAHSGRAEVARFYRSVYRTLRRNKGLSFPPVKNHFGQVLSRTLADTSPRFISQALAGGLTSLWGGTCLPLLPQEWEGCPVNAEDMEPWYQRIADAVGIAGAPDSLDALFSPQLVNRPPLRILPVMARLIDAIGTAGPFRIGQNRIAIETRTGEPEACTYCGECMMGCYRKSVWSAHAAWGNDAVYAHRAPTVHRIQGQFLECRDGSRWGGFDRILLAAGAYHTSRLVMRSFPELEPLPLQDNAIFQFPIVDVHLHRAAGDLRDYNALSQLLLVHPGLDGHPAAQIQIYPHFDTLLRSAVPDGLWPVLRGLQRTARGRVVWGRLYAPAKDSHHYRMKPDGLEVLQKPRREQMDRVLATLRRSLKGTRFWLPPIRPVCSSTSSHLAGPYSWAHPGVDELGRVAPGVHIVDGTLFPVSPVTSPTLAIMANAMRLAWRITRSEACAALTI